MLAVDGDASTSVEDAIVCWGKSLRAGAPEKDRDLAADVALRVVVLPERRKGHAVAGERRVATDRLLRTLVAREGDAFAVLERACLAVDRDGDAGIAAGAHAEHPHFLEVAAAIAAGLDAPFLQMVGNVCARQAEAFGVDQASLQFVRRDVGEPGAEVVLRNRWLTRRLGRGGQSQADEQRQAGGEEGAGHGRDCIAEGQRAKVSLTNTFTFDFAFDI